MSEQQGTLETPVVTGGERTREEILSAAHDLLKESGFRNFTVAALMERASVSRPAFYQYFASRYDVVAEIVRRIASRFDEVATPWLADPDAGSDQMLEGLVELAHMIADDGMLFRGIVDAAYADPQVEQAWRYGLVKRYCERTEQKIRGEQKAGRTPSELDAEIISLSLTLMTERVYYDRLASDKPDDPEKIATGVCEVWRSTLYPQR